MRPVDPEPPRKAGRPPEQLLVEPVPDTADGLREEQAWCRGVEEARDVGAPPPKHPDTGERPAGDAAPDAEAAVPNGERSPPRVRRLLPAGREKVETPAEDPGREAPQRHLVHERPLTTLLLPAMRDQGDRGDECEQVCETVCVDEERPEAETALAGTAEPVKSNETVADRNQ